MKMMMRMMRTMKTDMDTIAVACCLVTALFCMGKLSSDLESGRECKIELERERALRLQAQDLKVKMIQAEADEWCADSMDDMKGRLVQCEHDSVGEVMDLWSQYAKARLRDCESRNLQTDADRKACLGPAAKYNEVVHALEAIGIHQESR